MAKATRAARGRRTDRERADLVAAHIEPHPTNPGIAEYRLREAEYGYPVWAIIGALAPDASNAEQVAHDYAISHDAIAAARAFYEEHKREIDARLAANRAA